MPEVNFKPQIEWKNPTLFSGTPKGVNIPKELDANHVRQPIFVTMDQMHDLETVDNEDTKVTLAITKGLVTRELTPVFADPAKQWAPDAPGGKIPANGPLTFRFRGGDVILKLDLALYLLESGKPDPDDVYQDRLFALLYSHELLHVLDEVNTVTKFLGPAAKGSGFIQKNLIGGAAFTFGVPKQTAKEVQDEFLIRMNKLLFADIRNGIWALETNRTQAKRDSKEEYASVQEEYDKIQIDRVNRPIKKRK